MDMNGDYEVGDVVVYPAHGVGKINQIKAQKIGGQDIRVFEIAMIETGIKVVVPVGQNGLRKVIDKKGVDKIFQILKDRKTAVDSQTWTRRSRDYSQKLKTGSLFEIAKVLRDLSILKTDKELSFGEKQMFEKAKNLLVRELSIAKARTEDKVAKEIEEIFAVAA